MGLFSFLSGKKKETKAAVKAEPVTAARATAAKPTAAEKKAEAALKAAGAPAVAPIVVSAATGVAQAKLRLKLAASLRDGEHAAAYEAAKGLADIQAKAGRRVGVRVWMTEAEKIKAEMAA